MLPARPNPVGALVVLPAVPEAETSTPLTLTLTVTVRQHAAAKAPHAERRVITRTRDRVHVTLADGREWLFLQNPVDPRRVSALLTVHAERTIVIYEESELRNWEGIRGWADVVTLGVDAARLGTFQKTGQVRVTGGLRFERLVAREPDAADREIWWNAEHALPARVAVRLAGQTQIQLELEDIQRRPDDGRLRRPQGRFAQYRVVDLADWLER